MEYIIDRLVYTEAGRAFIELLDFYDNLPSLFKVLEDVEERLGRRLKEREVENVYNIFSALRRDMELSSIRRSDELQMSSDVQDHAYTGSSYHLESGLMPDEEEPVDVVRAFVKIMDTYPATRRPSMETIVDKIQLKIGRSLTLDEIQTITTVYEELYTGSKLSRSTGHSSGLDLRT